MAEITILTYSIADFLKELPVIVRKIEPRLSGVMERNAPLERTLKLRELQTSYVYTTVLAKKCRVRSLPKPAAMIMSEACHVRVTMGRQGPGWSAILSLISSQHCLLRCWRR